MLRVVLGHIDSRSLNTDATFRHRQASLARIAWAVLAKNEQYRPLAVADVAAA